MYVSKRAVALFTSAVVALVAVGITLISLLVTGSNPSSAPAAAVGSPSDPWGTESAVDYDSTGTTTTTAEPVLPAPEDFTLEVVVLSEQCFGSAGCSVRYQVEPTYVGETPLSELDAATIIYEVTGDENGPQTGSFDMAGGGPNITVPTQSSMATPSIDTAIEATVTQAVRNYN